MGNIIYYTYIGIKEAVFRGVNNIIIVCFYKSNRVGYKILYM